MCDDGDSFRFVLGSFDTVLGQQHALGDVLSRDLIPVGTIDPAVEAAGAVIPVRPRQLAITARAKRGGAPRWTRHDLEPRTGGGVLKRSIGAAAC
jgi:hypothetical protein